MSESVYELTKEQAVKLAAISHVASKDRPTLGIVRLRCKAESLEAAATDSYVLAVRSFDVAPSAADGVAWLEGDVAVDAKALSVALVAAAKASMFVRLVATLPDDQSVGMSLVVATASTSVTLQCNEHKFPDAIDKYISAASDASSDREYSGKLPAFNAAKFARLMKSTGYTAAKLPAVVQLVVEDQQQGSPLLFTLAGSSGSDWKGWLMPVTV